MEKTVNWTVDEVEAALAKGEIILISFKADLEIKKE